MVKFTHGFRVTSKNNTDINQPKPIKAKTIEKTNESEIKINCQPLKDEFIKESNNKNKGFI